MNEFLRDDCAECEAKIDLALEQFFNNILDCIIVETNEKIFKL